jgi:hypothetical protein
VREGPHPKPCRLRLPTASPPLLQTAAGCLSASGGLCSRRYPFLLVDRVLEWECGKYAVGYKNVTANDNFFPGHFPQRAIMPGARAAGSVRRCWAAGAWGQHGN